MGNNWESRANKVRRKKNNKHLNKPYRRNNKLSTDSKKNNEIEIKKAQKAKYNNFDELED